MLMCFQETQKNCIDLPDDDAGVVKKMIDYFYLLDYESDKDTGLYMVDTEPAAAADLAIEDIEDITTRSRTVILWQSFSQCDVRKCFEALTENGLDFNLAFRALDLVERNARENLAEDLM